MLEPFIIATELAIFEHKLRPWVGRLWAALTRRRADLVPATRPDLVRVPESLPAGTAAALASAMQLPPRVPLPAFITASPELGQDPSWQMARHSPHSATLQMSLAAQGRSDA
jgi:hypothetical protein